MKEAATLRLPAARCRDDKKMIKRKLSVLDPYQRLCFVNTSRRDVISMATHRSHINPAIFFHDLQNIEL